jgi:hypothetical protein
VTIRVTVPLKDVGKIERKMAQIWRQEMGKAMRKAASMCKPVLIARTVDAPPAKPGAVAPQGAIDQRKIIDNWEFIFTSGDLDLMIFNKADHAGYADAGVLRSVGKIGGPVARDLIASWMLRKGIQIAEKRGNATKVMPSARAARFLIFKINQRKTHWRFTPRAFVKRAAPRIKEIFNREILAQRNRMVEKAATMVITKGR